MPPVTEAGQSGFQEGNAAQYTWMVPQDLPGLVRGLGGANAATAKLDSFFSQLNAGQDHPFAWMGNEPSIGAPWAYLAVGRPWRAQAIVRTVMDTLYADRPDGIPGNDDLGTMSAWYVWSSLGLYPQFTAMRALDIGAPAFAHIEIRPPHGPRILIDAPHASAADPYVSSLSIDGRAYERSWLALPPSGTLHLRFALAAEPNRAWAGDPSDAMPAFGAPQAAFPASTDATIVPAVNAVDLLPGTRATIHIATTGSDRATLDVTSQDGLHASFDPATSTIALDAALPGLYDVRVDGRSRTNGAKLARAVIRVRVAAPGASLHLAWIANRFENTVMPYDPRTNALGVPVPVGEEPRDGVLTPDDARYFVADRASQSVSVVDTQSGHVVATVRVGNSPNGTAIDAAGRTVWVANYDDGTVQAIDTRTLVAGKPIAVGAGPRFIAVSPDGAHVYVSDQAQNTVSEIDTASMSVARTSETGARPTGIALSPDGTRLYLANNASQDVDVIDLQRWRIVARIPAGVEAQMVGLAPDGTFAYVPNFSSTTLTPIDLVHLRALPDITVGGQPFDVEWLRDGSAALVILRRDNALVRVDRSGRVGTPLFLGSGGAYTIALPH